MRLEVGRAEAWREGSLWSLQGSLGPWITSSPCFHRLSPDPISLEEMRRPGIHLVPRACGIAVAFSFCSGLSLCPTQSQGAAACLLELLAINVSWIWALLFKATLPWAENEPLKCPKQRRGLGPPWVGSAVLWRVTAASIAQLTRAWWGACYTQSKSSFLSSFDNMPFTDVVKKKKKKEFLL